MMSNDMKAVGVGDGYVIAVSDIEIIMYDSHQKTFKLCPAFWPLEVLLDSANF